MQAVADWIFQIRLSRDKYGPSLYSRIPNMSSLFKNVHSFQGSFL